MGLISSPERAVPSPHPDTGAARLARQVDRVREVLCNVIELSGMSRREVGRRLLEDRCGTDLGRVLKGRVALKVEHVLAFCRVVGIHPVEIFQLVFDRPRKRSPLLERIAALLALDPEKADTSGPLEPELRGRSIDELCQHVEKLTEQVEEMMRRVALPPLRRHGAITVSGRGGPGECTAPDQEPTDPSWSLVDR